MFTEHILQANEGCDMDFLQTQFGRSAPAAGHLLRAGDKRPGRIRDCWLDAVRMGREHRGAAEPCRGEIVLSSAVSRVTEAAAAQADASVPVLTRDGARATIRLNRPKHVNRIEPDDLAALAAHLKAVEADHTIRVVVLTGTGAPSARGYHLGDLGERIAAATPAAAAAGGDEASPFEQFTNQLENLRVPTICALNGPVYGGATDLALACDFRIGVAGMEMFMPAARLGLHYYPSGLRRYVSRLGLAAAKKLFLTAARIDGDEMLRIGYSISSWRPMLSRAPLRRWPRCLRRRRRSRSPA